MADGTLISGEIVPSADTARAFRQALGQFATGVTVVTTMGPDGPMGFTANSFSSLSLDPPLVLWSLAKSSSRFDIFNAAGHYAIHVLAQTQEDLALRFSKGGQGFADLNWHENADGAPILPSALARFDCAQHVTYPGGDHVIIVGQVLRLTQHSGAPLVFAQGRFGRFA